MSLIFGTLLMASVSVGAALPQKLLVFVFPDGSRGGIGKVAGLGKPVYKQGSTTFIEPEDTRSLLVKCGLTKSKMGLEMSHQFLIFAPSSVSDFRIVECFQKKTYRHFNVGWSEYDGRGILSINNDQPFRHFWRISEN